MLMIDRFIVFVYDDDFHYSSSSFILLHPMIHRCSCCDCCHCCLKFFHLSDHAIFFLFVKVTYWWPFWQGGHPLLSITIVTNVSEVSGTSVWTLGSSRTQTHWLRNCLIVLVFSCLLHISLRIIHETTPILTTESPNDSFPTMSKQRRLKVSYLVIHYCSPSVNCLPLSMLSKRMPRTLDLESQELKTSTLHTNSCIW